MKNILDIALGVVSLVRHHLTMGAIMDRRNSVAFDNSFLLRLQPGPSSCIIEPMSTCKHEILTLVPPPSARLRCRHCHLTISEQEIGDGCCPECLEAGKIKRRDFEKLESPKSSTVRYRCETCGMIITV